MVGAHAPVNFILREAGAGLVRLVLALLTVGELPVQLHHPLHAQRHLRNREKTTGCLLSGETTVFDINCLGSEGTTRPHPKAEKARPTCEVHVWLGVTRKTVCSFQPRRRFGVLVVTHRRRGDGVQADLRRGLALLVRARGDDADGLALDVGHLATMVKGHMASLPVGIAGVLRQGLRVKVILDDLALVRRLGCEQVPGDLLAVDHLGTLLLHRRGPARSPLRPNHHSSSR